MAMPDSQQYHKIFVWWGINYILMSIIWELIFFKNGISQSDLRVFTVGKNYHVETLLNIEKLQNRPHCLLHKGFKGTVVNQTLPCLYTKGQLLSFQ